MSENRRVVVTGVGAVTPLGNSAAETWEGLKNGKNGIGPITRFDTEKFKAKLGAEVRDFDPKAYMEVNDVLRTDRYAQFAVAAAQQAVDESGVEGTVLPERFAVIFASVFLDCPPPDLAKIKIPNFLVQSYQLSKIL